jgi:hypothetical protein
VKEPSVELTEEEVEVTEWEYSDRAPTDFLVSGPIGAEGTEWAGPGRAFSSHRHAEIYVRSKYGNRVRRAAPEAEMDGDRWAFLIRATQPAEEDN